MTHGPPRDILDRTFDGSSRGCEHLRRAICRSRPQLHCFGHIHGGWGSQRIAWRSQLGDDELEEVDLDDSGCHKDDAIVLPDQNFAGRNSSKKEGTQRRQQARPSESARRRCSSTQRLETGMGRRRTRRGWSVYSYHTPRKSKGVSSTRDGA